MTADRIAIFGGSFDPPHAGHIHVLVSILSMSKYEAIVVAPTAQNPLKGNTAASHQQRCEMLRILLSANRLYPSTAKTRIEISDQKYDFTFELVHYWKTNYSGQIDLVVGEDLLSQIPKWKNWETLDVNFLVIPELPEVRSSYVRSGWREFDPPLVEYIQSNKLYKVSMDRK
jgi:nicotinate-nucleotide adenylyltransferase